MAIERTEGMALSVAIELLIVQRSGCFPFRLGWHVAPISFGRRTAGPRRRQERPSLSLSTVGIGVRSFRLTAVCEVCLIRTSIAYHSQAKRFKTRAPLSESQAPRFKTRAHREIALVQLYAKVSRRGLGVAPRWSLSL